MDYPKSVPNVGLVNGKFIDENTVTGAVGSLIPSEWGNAVTDEVLAVIRAAELDPQEGQNDQLYQAIQKLVGEASTLPVGALVAFPLNTIAPGFLELDGSIKSIAAYPDLAAYLGTAFNKGDEGAGNFRLPESRGEFLRGWDHGRGVDAGRGVGSYQLDAVQNITGTLNARAANVSGSGTLIVGNASGAFGATEKSGGSAGTMALATTGAVTNPVDVYTLDASRVARTSTETRGRNLAVMWCIKAWGAPINQGNIDVAALVPLAAQATETNRGTVKIATQAQTDAGEDDATVVTPKKLRMGVSWNFGVVGWLALPSWLGGLIIQWGGATAQVGTTIGANSYAFPMAFPNQIFRILGYRNSEMQNSNNPSTDHYFTANLLNWTVTHVRGSGSVATPFVYLAIGR